MPLTVALRRLVALGAGDLDGRPGRRRRLCRDERQRSAREGRRFLLDQALDLDSEQVGCGLLQLLLDRELERRGRGRAAVAASVQPETEHVVLEARAPRRRRRATPCRGGRVRAPRARGSRGRPGRARGSAAGSRRPRRTTSASLMLAPGSPASSSVWTMRSSPSPYSSSRASRSSCAVSRAFASSSASTRATSSWSRSATSMAYARPVGVCTTFFTRPLPRYMCTPHGRHGSKLRTARMMSMPLKFSGPFSSKIGVFCTASS